MKNTLAYGLLLVLLALPELRAQEASPEKLLALITSPYESERRHAIGVLAQVFRTQPNQFDRWIAHDSVEVRAACLRAWAQAAAQVADLPRAFSKLSTVQDKTLERAVAIDLMSAAIKNWRGELAILPDSARHDPDLVIAARAAIHQELDSLAQVGTQATEHEALAALSVLGALSEDSLAALAEGSSLSTAARSLAVSALARTDATAFFCTADGKIAPSLQKLLNSNYDSIKLAALYGAAFRGLNSPTFLTEMCHYLREDAFNEYTIEAALYLLHTRGPEPLQPVKAEIALCLKEFLDSLYSQRARYHCAFLMAASGFAEAVDAALQVVEEDCQFSSFWLVATAFNRASELPPERAQAVEARALALALGADATPQLRALALWYLTDRGLAVPAGLERESVIKAVHESMADLSAAERDPDFYALRSGLEVLAFLKDPDLPAAIRNYLGHESEAVRMVAARAAGQGDYRSVTEALAAILAKPFEYAGFSAAMTLDQFGDRRGTLWLASYLASGNACILPATLSHLETKFGKQLGTGPCLTPSDYRRRSALWLAELNKAEE